MNPSEHVRVVLVESRRRGLSFGEAWLLALQTLPRPQDEESRVARLEWLESFAWARPFFHCSYVGRPFAEQHLLDAPADEVREAA